MLIRNCALLVLAAASAATVIAPADAQFVQEHIIAVDSSTPASAKEFLQGHKGAPAKLAGKLRLAKNGSNQPVVVILPGGGGIGSSRHPSNEWARVLNEAGISTFILDSFTGRTLYEMAKHRSLPPIVRTLDAFAALQALSTHPFVDGNKISIMGFSHGGVAAMLTNAGRFREAYGNGLRFASHISLYGICSIGYRGEEDVSRPMLIMHGEADDWVPSAPCIDYTDRLKRAGKSIQLITYPDAHHIFDLVPVGTVKRVDFPTPFWCRQLEANAGDIVVVDTGKPLGQEDACWRKTVSFGYNEAATKKAHSDVLAFLKSVVGE